MLPRLTRFFRGDPLPNTGSLARDLLASERTFLAWTRTGLGFIALGVALEKVEALATLAPALLQLENSNTKLAAGTLVASGSVCVVHGASRYFGVLRDLKGGVFRPNRFGVLGLAGGCLGLAVVGTVAVVEGDGERKGKREQVMRVEG
ncbi:hypothetical protein LTR08_004462 [Meristemomyces frigidus]|nr:hypothetical protein LTR08_004462 [Meristemomyces frigidus]